MTQRKLLVEGERNNLHSRRLAFIVILLVLFSMIVLWSPFARASIVTPMFFMLIPLSFLFISKFKKIGKKLRLKSKFSMLLLLTIVLLVTVSIARLFSGTMFQIKPVHAWWDNNWDYCRKITIDSSKVDEALTNFPVLVYLNSSRINWTNVQDDLDDLRFIADDNSTVLKYEIENYTVNNDAWLWVKIPSASNTSDTSFLMYYGNNACSSGEDAENVWDSNYVMVQHMNDNTTSSILDSTSNNNDGTKKGAGEPTATTSGKIDDAQYFDGTDDYIALGSPASLQITNGTLMAWVKTTNAGGSYRDILDYPQSYGLWTNENIFGVYDWAGGGWKSSGVSINDGNWHQVVFVKQYNIASGSFFYVDGVQVGSAITYASNSYTSNLKIGVESSGLGEAFNGTIDEVRISNASRSGAWIKASYYSGKDELLTFGSEELGNTAPTNDQLTLDLTGASYKGTKTLLAGKQDYKFVHLCTDANGVTDITYAEIRLDCNGKNVILRATRGSGDTWTFSEQSDPSNYVTFNTGGSSHSTSGNQKTFNYLVTINWAWGDSAETVAVQAYVIDSQSASDTDNYASVFGVEAHLTSFSLAVNDYRCNPSQTLTMSGYWYYDGTSIAPPDGNYNVVVKLSGVQKGSTDTTLVSGAFSISDVTAESSISSYSYTVEATYMSGAGSFSAVIVDRIKVSSYTVSDSRANINDSVNIDATLVYEYSSTAVTTGTITINTYSASHQGSGVYRITRTSSSVTSVTYNTVAGSESTHDLNTVNQNSQSTTVIWDNIVVSGKGVTVGRTNINSYQQYWFTLRSQYDSAVVSSGTVTLNGSLSASWISARSRWEYNTTKSSAQAQALYAASVNWDTYGITSLSSQTSNSTSIVWDNIVVSGKGVTSTRLNINSYAQYWFTLRSQYDGTPVQVGTVSLNGSVSASYISARTRWEYNVTKSTVQKMSLYVASVSWSMYGITSLSSQTANYTTIIWDRIRIDTLGVVSGRINVNTQGTYYATASLEYDSHALGSGDSLTLSSHIFTWNVGNSRFENNTTMATVTSVTINSFTSGNEATYGITAGNVNAKTTSIIWDRLTVNYKAVDNSRRNINTAGAIRFKLRSEYDSAFVTSGSVSINGTGATWDAGNSWWYISYTLNAINIRYFAVSAANWNTYGITALNSGVATNTTSIIWDRIRIDTLSKTDTDGRVNVNSQGTFYATASLEYDGHALGSGDSLTLSDCVFTWVSARSRFEYNVTKSSVQALIVNTFTSGNEATYGIIVGNINSQTGTIIWDRVVVTISADSTGPDAGQTVNFTVTAVYDYDDASVTSWTVNIYRNGTHFATGNFTDKSDSEVKYLYTTENVTDNIYDLTAFTSNTVTVVWGNLFIEVNEINIQDSRINIGTQATVYYHCRFSSNQSSCTTGTLYVNGTSFTINSTGWATVTFTFSEVDKKALVVTAIDVNGETDFQQGPSNPEIIWDRVNVTISADGTYVILKTKVNFTITAIYEFDSNSVTSWIVNICRNSTYFATGNFTDTQTSPSVYEYTIENITEGTYGLTVFQSNMVTVEWYNSPPVASFNYSPEFPIAGNTVTFNASKSYDADGTINVYKWNFSDGTPIESSPAPTIMHVFGTRGNYTVTLALVDDKGAENKTEATITIIANPTADFTYSPTYPITGETVTFNASASAPNGGTIISYFWNFSDGTTANVSSAITTHAYLSFGNYTVALTVKDSEGLTNSRSKIITVIDYPSANFTYSPAYPIARETVTFNASASKPNGGTIISYFWDFGDATNSTGLVTGHIYHAFGTYVVTLKVVDSEQLANSTSQLINVRQHPTANFTYSPLLPVVGQTVTFNASLSEPNGGTIITYTWNFGDAQTGTGMIINHTYSTYRTYNVTLTVTDSEGLSNTFAQIVRIIIQPTADFMYAPTYPVFNQSVLFDASISYDPDGIIMTYTWSFGDGNVTTVSGSSIRHAFENATTYDVTLTVTDNDGLTNTITKRITVYTTVVLVHDVAITSIEPKSSWVYQGKTLNITVTVTNEGTDLETFNVSLYYDNTKIRTHTVINLFPGKNLTLTFAWNTTNLYPAQYNISAVATILPEETDTADNTLVYGTISVLWMGDINHDGKVDMRDIARIARGFGSHSGEPRYDPNCDLNNDGKIDMRDIAPAAKNFGKP